MFAAFWIAAAAAATGPVDEQSEAASDPDVIVVTGERVQRSLKETSSSVAVASAREIEAAGANRVDQIVALIPNVQLGNGSQGPSIRGQDTTGALQALPAFLGGNRPRTTVIVDGRAVTYNEFVFGAFPVWDVSRIEVFRSPQTTTQGQNSIAGAIFIDTEDPSFTPEYRGRAIAGDYKQRQLSALASGPLLGDDVAFRVAGDIRYARTTSHIANVQAGADPNHDVYGILRAKLLAEPAAGTELLLTYVHSQSQAPQVVGVDAPFKNRRDRMVGYGIFRINVDSLAASVRQHAGEHLTANFLLTAGDSRSRRFAIRHFGEAQNDGRDWSAEAILNWAPDGPLGATAGVSHQHLALDQFIDLALLSGSTGRFRDEQDGTGLFGEGRLQLSRFTFTGGLRYQRDRQKRRGALTADSFVIPVDFVGTFHSWLPKVSLAFDVSQELRVGAMLQKAYNPGGTTIRVDTARPDDFAAESLWDYELFARGQWGRVSGNANLFYYDMTNAQRSQEISLFTPSGGRVGFANMFNVPGARSYGAEGQLSWHVGRGLSANLALGLLRTKIVRSDDEVPGIEGNEFDRAPHLSGSLAVDWRATPRLRMSAQVRHHSAYFSDAENKRATKIGSATIADARAEYRLSRLSLFAQVRNMFDTLAMLDLDTATQGEAEDPRTFAIGVDASF